MDKHIYLKFYKPFGVLSQFTDEGKYQGLSHWIKTQQDVYPLGRLDADSEGLLLLTNNRSLNNKLLHPSQRHHRTYLCQVEGIPDEGAIQELNRPMTLNIKGKAFTTEAAKTELLEIPPVLPERDPPIRYRKNVPTSWIKITLCEGKNRQVRKMTAQSGFPTLRLVRWAIEDLTAENLDPGAVRAISEMDFYRLLHLHK